MRERPILFSAPMVRAILAGQKTQTRRAVKGFALQLLAPDNFTPEYVADPENHNCPYGNPGDRLWVRETYIAFGRWETRFSEKKGRDEWHFVDLTLESGRQYGYVADGDWPWPFKNKRALAGATPCWWTRPAIFMPRAASRIVPQIASVRVERLQGISEADARAEGCQRVMVAGTIIDRARDQFEGLWSSINGADSWKANPWVWVVEFKRLEA